MEKLATPSGIKVGSAQVRNWVNSRQWERVSIACFFVAPNSIPTEAGMLFLVGVSGIYPGMVQLLWAHMDRSDVLGGGFMGHSA